jgi:VWA domain containing CoxE-like protein
MATSVVYSSIFAAVMASVPGIETKLICFDTAIVDLTEQLADPVEVLFGVQLGGGTDINGIGLLRAEDRTPCKDASGADY